MSIKRPLRIALISRYYPPDPGGGLAHYTQQIAGEFVQQGHQVTVIAGTPTNRHLEETDNGVIIKRVPQLKVFERSITGFTCLLNSYRIAKTIERLHHQKPIDIVHCPATFYESLVFGRFYKLLLQIPLVIKFHENRETYERIIGGLKTIKASRRQWLKQFLRAVSLDANYWLGVSENSLSGMLDYLELAHLPYPKSVSPSPIDLELFKPVSIPPEYFERYGLLPNTPFLFYSGRLIFEKGLHLLVEAFLSHVAPRFPNLMLAIAGEFDYRQPYYEQQIRKQIAGHPDAKRILFLGRIAYDHMPYWYTQCTAFVAPSFCEPFGRIYIEAMACQALTVGFNDGGAREIITHGEDGYLIEEQRADSLGQALCHLLESPELCYRLRHNSRRTVQARYSKEKIAAELLEIYLQLACKKPLKESQQQMATY